MKKTVYVAPAIITTEIQLHPLMEPSIVATGGDAGVTPAGPDEDVPGTAQSRRKSVWDEEEEEEDF